MRVKNSPKAPPAEFFRQQRLRANRMMKPHVESHNGAQFIIAANGIRIPLQYAETVQPRQSEGLFETVSTALRDKAVKVS
jgi:hypothetical protein